jgi:hypothetical protein
MKNKEEKQARKLLKSMGFALSTQKDERHEGVDIIAMKKGKVLLVEVKKASLNNRAWQVDKVSPKQAITCDTIAIVSPFGIEIMTMKDHLKLCKKDGKRYVTDMVNLHKALGA